MDRRILIIVLVVIIAIAVGLAALLTQPQGTQYMLGCSCRDQPF
ncbi:MAG: hypothetical protein RQ885_15710 [Desulfurococcales archaeon]|nr:hypothetical protein [Desulfurococcales archaeon]